MSYYSLLIGNQILYLILIFFNLCLLGVSCLFACESFLEREPRATKFGIVGVLLHGSFIFLLFYLPVSRVILLIYFLIWIFGGLILLIPGKKNAAALLGTAGFVVGEVSKADERDIVFSRNNLLNPGSEQYKQYYQLHPEREERDSKRRAKGGNIGNLGSIDKSPPAIVNMVRGSQSTTKTLVTNSLPEIPDNVDPLVFDPKMMTETIKQWALHLGADLVGVAKVDQRWMYSHKGFNHSHQKTDTWGEEINRDLTHAVVIATEMDHNIMSSAPHSPVVMETMKNYSKGAFITSTMANWFTQSGYTAVANHASYYESLMVPLGIDAGIGQMSRMGYLITEKFGARIRLAAVLTNMPLKEDRPVDLGVDEFCQACKKCAESCPSRSIPKEGKVVKNGLLRWLLNDESCHDYWGRAGTDCGVCMIICPYSRPDRFLHRLVKWLLKHSTAARKILPHLDNVIYGKIWKTRRTLPWLPY